MEIRTVGVVGLGTMGAGIAEVFARGGLRVIAAEADPAALARGMAAIAGSLDKAVARGKLTGAGQAEVAGRIEPVPGLAGLAPADLVIEAVPETLPMKRQVVAELDRACRPDAIFATNTSSLPVTAIAAASARPGRVVGMHFFNPAPVMRLVEVVSTVRTDPAVSQLVTDLARRLGKAPVQVGDRAGFVANALLLPYLNHAARLLETGYATREDIDAAATQGLGLPMGPLRLLDLIGLDTSLAVLEALQRELGGTRAAPAPILRRLTEAGRTGRKSGGGFYDYPERAAARPAGSDGEDPDSESPNSENPNSENASQQPGLGTVTLIDPPVITGAGDLAGQRLPGRPPGLAAELAGLFAGVGLSVTSDPAAPSDLVVVAIGAQGGVLGPALAAGRAADAVGLHLVTPALAELAVSPLTTARALAAAQGLLARLGLRAICSPDRPGLLTGALLYPHLRDAVVMVEEGYASPADIDTAMTLGCGYPRGPMRMLAEAGPGQAVDVLTRMHAVYADPSFAPPPLLAECAMAGITPEAVPPEVLTPGKITPAGRP